MAQKSHNESEPVDPNKIYHFEEAMNTTGYGRYNLGIVFISLCTSFSVIFQTTTIAYLMTCAECDLRLDNYEKSYLLMATYVGMALGSLPWGIFSDTYGRRNVLLYGFFLDAIVVISSSLVANLYWLYFFKFLGGACVCGPFSTYMPYILEFHQKSYRARVLLCSGVCLTLGTLGICLLAILTIPIEGDFLIYGIKWFTWQLFLLTSCIPSFLGFITMIFLPESPKFLMSKGRNDEALDVFRKIARGNGRTFLIKNLADEKNVKDIDIELSFCQKLCKVLQNILVTLASKDYRCVAICACMTQFGINMCQNTIRLWLPQIFSTEQEYETTIGEPDDICDVLKYDNYKSEIIANDTATCQVYITVETYWANFVTGGIIMVAYFISMFLITKLGAKVLLCSGLLISCAVPYGLFYTNRKLSIAIVTAIYLAVQALCTTTVINCMIVAVPTGMRATLLSLSMTFSPIGSLIGIWIFPYLEVMGCVQPIAWLSVMAAFSFCFAIFLPNPTRGSLVDT